MSKPRPPEPLLEVRLLVTPLAMQEVAQDGLAADDHTRVGGENHVRQAGLGRDQLHTGDLPQP